METLLDELRRERVKRERLEKLLFEALDQSGVQYDALVQKSSGWHKARQGKLTASRFGVICEQSRYATARSYWELLTGKLPPDASSSIDNADTRRGNDNESVALKVYCDITQAKVELSGLFVPPEPLQFLGASPDALILDGLGIVEIKCPARGHYDAISDEYMAQIQGQLSICQRDYCDFVSFHVETGSTKIWRVWRSEDYWQWMLPLLRFFHDCLKSDSAPPFRSQRQIGRPPKVATILLHQDQ